MKFLKFLFVLLFLSGLPILAQQPLRNQFTTNQAMNAVQDGFIPFWNDTAKRWSNAVPPSGVAGGQFNINQFTAAGTTNIKTSPFITNIFNFSTLNVTGFLAGIDVDTGTAGQRWLIDPLVGALNYFGTSGYLGLNGSPFILFSQSLVDVPTNMIVRGTNDARWLKLSGGVPAQTFGIFDSNTNLVGGIPTNAFANHAQLVVVSNYVTSATNSAQVTNWIVFRQPASTTLSNLSGTGAITNVFSKSLSNSTMVPLMRGPVGASINATNANGEFYGLEAGANITLTPNPSNIVIASTASGGGTNFSGIELTNAINQAITNATGTSVTADWNGPTWMRLNLSGTTTISFTNCPAAISSKGKTFLLELYSSSAAPAVTFQNIDDRPISWRGIGSPVLIDTLTNFFTVRFDGTNFIGESHQDRTTGLIESPVVLAHHNVQSNANFKGITIFTNQPGDGSPTIRLAQTNGQAYYELSTLPDWKTTNRWILATTNESAGEVLKIQATSVSGGIRTTIWTNGVDSGGSGSPGGAQNSIQVNQPNGTFYGTNTTTQVFAYDSTNGNMTVGSSSRKLDIFPNRVVMRELQDFGLGIFMSTNWIIASGSGAPAGSFVPTTSNTVYIGRATNPAARIYLSEELHFTGGTVGAGKVLTDVAGDGNYTPQTPSGGGGTNFDSIIVTNQIFYNHDFISGNMVATNLDFQVSREYSNTTNIVVDVTFALTNPLPSGMSLLLIGQTNAATNHTISFTAAGGATINHLAGTNGSVAFTLFSNSVAYVEFKVYTNLVQTNIIAEWKSDSGWPQRNTPLIASVGGSQSNFTAGGLIYYDYVPNAYTNHSGNQTFANANYTNLAFKFLDGNSMTNVGDSVRFVWRGTFRGANNGTNQLIAGIGTVTNGLGDTGQFTNRANASWQYEAEVTAIGNTNHSIYWKFELAGATTLTGNFTNGQYRDFATGILTNGVTNVVRLQHKGVGPGAISNDYFRVFYQGGHYR